MLPDSSPSRSLAGFSRIVPLTLLNQLRQTPDDADAWRRFDAIYRPLLTAWLRRYSLQPHDCDDLVQDILQVAVRELPCLHDQRLRGHFHGWLHQIMINRLRAFWRARKRHGPFVELPLDQLYDPAGDLDQRWDREHDQHILQALLVQLEPDLCTHNLAGVPAAARRRTAPGGGDGPGLVCECGPARQIPHSQAVTRPGADPDRLNNVFPRQVLPESGPSR